MEGKKELERVGRKKEEERNERRKRRNSRRRVVFLKGNAALGMRLRFCYGLQVFPWSVSKIGLHIS